MILNVLFQVAILSGFQAALTLPGIAGLVLTIGMAVDSNIIIYARIRDELRAGKSVRSAVDAGFNRAFWTVFDAHVANFLAGFVLMQYGTGPIKGFAVALLIGVVEPLHSRRGSSRSCSTNTSRVGKTKRDDLDLGGPDHVVNFRELVHPGTNSSLGRGKDAARAVHAPLRPVESAC